MNRDIKAQLSESVIVIDLDFLNLALNQSKSYLENIVGGVQDKVSLVDLLTYIALDGGVRKSDNGLQVIFVCGDDKGCIDFCSEVDKAFDIDGKAVSSALGEMSFYAVSNEELISSGELFCDIAEISADDSAVKNLILVGNYSTYGEVIDKIFNSDFKKNITLMTMQQSEDKENYKIDFLGFAIMKAFGVQTN